MPIGLVTHRGRVGCPSAGGVAEWLRQGTANPCTRVRFPAPPPISLRTSVGARDRVEPPRRRQPLELGFAAVEELDPGTGDEVPHRVRHQLLTWSCEGTDAGGDVH